MKNKKVEVIPIAVKLQQQAQSNFASHVQSIAFNLTLSRRMIDCLQTVRDYGFPHYDRPSKEEEALRQSFDVVTHRVHNTARRQFITRNFVGFMTSLERRGLVVFQTSTMRYHDIPHGTRTVILSRAGDLVCQLMVEAGLMAPAVEEAEAKKAVRR